MNAFKCPMCGEICKDLGQNQYFCLNKCDAGIQVNKELSAGKRIAARYIDFDLIRETNAAQEIDAAIRDSNAELVELLQKSRAELHPVIHRVLYHQITEALARHGAKKETYHE